jgi:hypothetical protein
MPHRQAVQFLAVMLPLGHEPIHQRQKPLVVVGPNGVDDGGRDREEGGKAGESWDDLPIRVELSRGVRRRAIRLTRG